MKKDVKTLLFENMSKLNYDFSNEAFNSNGLPAQTGQNQAVGATQPQPVQQQPSDVKTLGNVAQMASTVNTAAKRIDTTNEFAGAFQNWFATLGYNPQKISKSKVIMDITKVLNNLGYR